MANGENTLDRLCWLATERNNLRTVIKAASAARNLPSQNENLGDSVQLKIPGTVTPTVPAGALGAAALDGILTHLHDRLAEVEGLLIDCARNLEIPE